MSDHYETRCPSCGGSDEQGCYADCPTATIPALRAEVERLRAALKERCPVDAMDREGMTPAQAAIWHVWGERCSDFEPECLTCRAWAEFGQIARLRAALDAICMMDISWVGDAWKLKDIARAELEERT